jgi:hypothetical protein
VSTLKARAAPVAAVSADSALRAAASLVKLNCSTFLPWNSTSLSGKRCVVCSPSASMVQYSWAMKAAISSSR